VIYIKYIFKMRRNDKNKNKLKKREYFFYCFIIIF
jgi:hypothetical protein